LPAAKRNTSTHSDKEANTMTQQPYPPQQYPQPGYPQQYPAQQPQGYPAQPQQPYAPAPYPQGQQPYPGAPQGYPGQAPAPAAPPAQAGSIDDYYSQPVAAGGPGISWKDKPIGTTYVGVIASAPSVQQDSDYTTKLPKFQRDGVTPQWVMLIPLERVQSNYATPNGQPEHPTGEVVFYARGKDKEELNRAMAEAGCSGAPQVGATFQVTLVERKPQRQGNPKNVVRIGYTPPNGQPHQAAPQASAAPVQQEAVAAPPAPAPQAAPAPAPQPTAPQQFQQPPVQYAAPQAQPQVQQLGTQPMQAPLPAGVPQAAPAQAAPAQAAPAQAAPAPAPQPPAGMTPEAQNILAGLTGQQG
jgi:hypothetical protein